MKSSIVASCIAAVLGILLTTSLLYSTTKDLENDFGGCSETCWVGIGIITATGVAIVGIFITLQDRKNENKKRNVELIQKYGTDLTEIMKQEANLKTRLDCSLYVEQYLDTLEQIASLYKDKALNKDVIDFFENNFAYGLTLLDWYKRNVYSNKDFDLACGEEGTKDFRWREANDYCNNDPQNKERGSIEPFDKIVLPDIMRDDYLLIPEENGVEKPDLIEIIREYGKDLADLSNKENNLKTKLDCSLYAEQYLDTLEQIASLYNKNIIPKRAADYFENKFAYGLTLLNWYKDSVYVKDDDTKQSRFQEVYGEDPNEARWIELEHYCEEQTQKIEHNVIANPIKPFKLGVLPDVMLNYSNLPEEDGLNKAELLELVRNYGNQLTELSDKERILETQIDCSVYTEQYLDTLEQIAYLYNKKIISIDMPTYFETNFAYGLTLKHWYDLHVIGANSQEDRWREFEKYCQNFVNEEKEKKSITPFAMEDVLPRSMLIYEKLKPDKTGIDDKNYSSN